MPSLKDLRNRIRSVKSTQKITSAMKVVAASRLKRAQDAAEAARPYAERMQRMTASLARSMSGMPTAPPLLQGTGSDATQLLIVATSDRGLAGGFNATILREARRQIRDLQRSGKTVKVLTIGRKGRDSLRRDFGSLIVESYTEIGRRGVGFGEVEPISAEIAKRFRAGEFDRATIVFNTLQIGHRRRSSPRVKQLVPLHRGRARGSVGRRAAWPTSYEFEPDEGEIFWLSCCRCNLMRSRSLRSLLGEHRQRAGRAHDGDG